MSNKRYPTGRLAFLPKVPSFPGFPDRFWSEAAMLIGLSLDDFHHFFDSLITSSPRELGQHIQDVQESYQIKGALSLVKPVPMANKYGRRSLRCSQRLNSVSVPDRRMPSAYDSGS